MATRGFSLIEVVLAVGVAGIAIATVLALLPMLSRHNANAADAMIAAGLGDAIRLEMERQALSTGFANFTGAVRNRAGAYSLVADSSGSRLHARDDILPPTEDRIPDAEQYFHIALAAYSVEPLAYAPGKYFFAVQSEVSWPYRTPAAHGFRETPETARESVRFVVVINR